MPHGEAVLTDVGIWAGAVVPVLFFLHYTYRLRVRWWLTPTGRAIVGLDFAAWLLNLPLAAVLAAPKLALDFRHVIDWMVTASLVLAPLIIVYRGIAFERKRFRVRREEADQARAYVATMKPLGDD